MEIRTLDSGITVVDSNIDGFASIGNTLGGLDLQSLEIHLVVGTRKHWQYSGRSQLDRNPPVY